MFVNPINFNFTNANRLRNNEGSENPTPAEPKPEPAPQEEAPKMRPALMQDTVSFGGDKKHRRNSLASVAAAAALVAGGPLVTSCADDFEHNMSQTTDVVVNLKDYHKCGCGDIPIVIPRDTVYMPADTVYMPGDTIRIPVPGDTIYMPADTVYMPGDTVKIIQTDTIWMKPDTVYIPKDPHFEINDSINKDIDDFDIPTDGDGDFVYAFQGRNEYLRAQHLLIFDGFFSNEHKSSFIDHAFVEDDIPAGGDKPSKYYYTRYDISSDYSNGRRLVQVYKPRFNQHQLPDDKKNGEAGWQYAGEFYVKNASVAGTAQLIANDMDGTIKGRITKNEKRGEGNLYKEWTIDDGTMPKTTIQNAKAYKTDIKKLK